MENKNLCEHLKPLLEALLVKGASIEAVQTGWSKVELIVTLSKGLYPNEAMKEAKNRGLEFWENNDSHYPLDYGWSCEKCGHAVSWPKAKSVINAI